MLRKLALAAAATVLALLAAEAALRVAGAAGGGTGAPWWAGGNHPRFLVAPDPRTGYRLRPGFEGEDVAASGEFRVPVAIDERGLRSHGAGGERTGGVLAVGDSFTYGEGVAAEETFAARLEADLGVPVANAGIPGYSTRQMAARAAELLPRLRPRLVLVTFVPILEEPRCPRPFVYHQGFIVGPGYRDRLHVVDGNLLLEQVRHPVLGPWSVALMRRSHLLRLALPAARRLILGGGTEERPPDPDDWRPCLEALEDLERRAEDAGAELLVVLAESHGEAERAATARISTALRSAGIPHLLLDERLGGADPELRYPRDHHWNRTGHARVAAALAPEVRRRLEAATASPPPPPAGARTAPPGPEDGT